MIPDNEAEFWYGVAKLNVSGESWCNAVLVSKMEAVTAAHCLYRATMGKLYAVSGTHLPEFRVI